MNIDNALMYELIGNKMKIVFYIDHDLSNIIDEGILIVIRTLT